MASRNREALGIVFLLAGLSPAAGQGLTGERLYDFCRERAAPEAKEADRYLCLGFIRGIIDGARLQALRTANQSIPEHLKTLAICEPGGCDGRAGGHRDPALRRRQARSASPAGRRRRVRRARAGVAMQAVSKDAMREGLTVYYDGGCPLCRAEIGHYRRCAGAERIAFVDVGRDAPQAALGPDLDRAAAWARFHVRDADGRLASGAAAFTRLWQVLPAWRWLGRLVDLRVFGRRPVLPLAEAAYRLSLPLRPRLARLLAPRRDRA